MRHKNFFKLLIEFLNNKHIVVLTIMFLLGFILWDKSPIVLNSQSWHINIIFFCTIFAIMTNVMPIGMCALTAVAFSVGTNTIKVSTALSGFSSPITWLVICAFFLSDGIIKTGLGSRISFMLLSRFGGSLYGVAYSLISTELLLAPLIPSSSARSSGILLPIMHSIISEYQNDDRNLHVEKFLTMLLYHSNIITSAMFITAMAANPLAVSIMANYGIEVTWLDWAKVALIPGCISLLILPLILMQLIKPNTISGDKIQSSARIEISNIGSIKGKECIMLAIFLCLIFMWILEHKIGISTTTSAMLGVVAILFARIINWSDIIQNKTAWDCLIWYGTLLMLADCASKSGSFTYASSFIYHKVQNFNILFAICTIIAFFVYSHYFFASTTAHLSSLMGISIASLNLLGANMKYIGLLLAFLTSISGGFTHYGMSSAPALFATGYVKMRKWWYISAVVSNINIAIWTCCVYLFSRLLS